MPARYAPPTRIDDAWGAVKVTVPVLHAGGTSTVNVPAKASWTHTHEPSDGITPPSDEDTDFEDVTVDDDSILNTEWLQYDDDEGDPMAAFSDLGETTPSIVTVERLQRAVEAAAVKPCSVEVVN